MKVLSVIISQPKSIQLSINFMPLVFDQWFLTGTKCPVYFKAL